MYTVMSFFFPFACMVILALPSTSAFISTVNVPSAGRGKHGTGSSSARRHRSEKAVGSLCAVGFGGGGSRGKSPGVDDAKQALRTSGGDINRATAIVFNQRLSLIEAQDKDLADEIKQLYAPGASVAAAKNEAVHHALVAATWDAVAIMNSLPSRKTTAEEREEKRISRRLQEIADAARLPPAYQSRSGEDDPSVGGLNGGLGAKILDVGCGDGTLMPFLLDSPTGKPKKKKGKKEKTITENVENTENAESAEKHGEQLEAPAKAGVGGGKLDVVESQVTGVDLSPVMIQSARRKYKSRWLVGDLFSLAELLHVEPQPVFTSAVFNGSLQFFLDPAKALKEASAWVVDGGHVVVSHVQGIDFVEDECRRNPRVAPSPIPFREGMEELAARAGLTLLEGGDNDSQRNLLLYVLRKS